jgi:hypothetical protein
MSSVVLCRCCFGIMMTWKKKKHAPHVREALRDMGEFIRLFQLEPWVKVDQTLANIMKAPTTDHRPRKKTRIARKSGCKLFALILSKEAEVEFQLHLWQRQ